MLKKFEKTLAKFEKRLTVEYGEDFTKLIIKDSRNYFIELIPRIPYYNTAIYRPIILFNAQLIAIVKAMKAHEKNVEDVFKIQVDFLREDFKKIPAFVGKIWISKFAGYFLNKMAEKGTKEGWISEFKRGTEKDDFEVSVFTKKMRIG